MREIYRRFSNLKVDELVFFRELKSNMKKLLATALLFVVLSVPFSCEDPQGSCPDEEYINTITDLSLSIDTTGDFMGGTNTFSADEVLFRVRVRDLEEEVRMAAAFQGFATNAMALSCIYRSSLKHTLDEIRITSSAAVTTDEEVFEAGQLLNEIFSGSLVNFTQDFQSIGETLVEINENSEFFSSYDGLIEFKLSGVLEEDINQPLTFQFIFSDRTITVDTGETVITVD